MDNATIALIISAVTLVINLVVTIFGGGRGLSDRFAALKQSTDTKLSELHKEIHEKQDRSENSVGDSLRAMREHTHAIEKSALEFRAIAAETYLRRDTYFEASKDLKRDVNAGFEKIEQRLQRIENKFDRREAHE